MDDYDKKLNPDVNEIYLVLFEDTSDSSGFLFIYVDSITGDVIGCLYTPEIKTNSKVAVELPTEAKITASDAERIAFEAAKKARNTVPYWKDAEIKNMKCHEAELTNDRLNYVASLDDYDKKLDPDVYLVYSVQFSSVPRYR